jgi:hypothetical protein
VISSWLQKSRYTGFAGVLTDGTTPAVPAPLGFDTSIQISLAPAIEYNFNQYFGIICGSWFSIFGRNAAIFRSGIIAFNYYY